MKRDFTLILKILEYFEERQEVSVVSKLHIKGYENSVVAYHVRRMYEAGLLDAEAITSSTTEDRLINVLPFGLTWEGHEFLDSIRQKGVLNKLKERFGNAITEVPFSVIKGLVLSYVKDLFGL